MKYNHFDTVMINTPGSYFDKKSCFESADALFDCYDSFNETEGSK